MRRRSSTEGLLGPGRTSNDGPRRARATQAPLRECILASVAASSGTPCRGGPRRVTLPPRAPLPAGRDADRRDAPDQGPLRDAGTVGALRAGYRLAHRPSFPRSASPCPDPARPGDREHSHGGKVPPRREVPMSAHRLESTCSTLTVVASFATTGNLTVPGDSDYTEITGTNQIFELLECSTYADSLVLAARQLGQRPKSSTRWSFTS